MATLLLAWELGEGLGHDQRLLRIGRALAAEGHRPIFVLGNVTESWRQFQQESFPVLQAPYWNWWPGRNTFMAGSYADVLAVRGWEKVETLLPLVEAWQRLIDYIQPSLIVIDHAPTLCLAAYRTLPVVQVGGWFSLPPASAPTFPPLVPDRPPVIAQENLLAVVQEVQQVRKRPVPRTLTDIFAATNRFPISFAELDPYQPFRQEAVWHPFDILPPLVQEKAGLPGFFAYLRADNSNVEQWLIDAARTGLKGTAYLRGATAGLKERLRSQGLTVTDEPVPLAEALKECTIILHHGGSTTANMAFAAGRPQLVFPQHLEQALTAKLLEKLGVGVFVPPGMAPDTVGRAVRDLASNKRWSEAASNWASRCRQRTRVPTLPAVVERCRERLRQPA